MAITEFDSFRPTMLMRGLASSAAGTGYRDAGIRRMRKEMAAEGDKLADRDEGMAFADAVRADRIQEDRAARAAAPIEGESAFERMHRMQNQAFSPNLFGKQYREGLLKNPLQADSPVQDFDEERRRKRMAMASAGALEY